MINTITIENFRGIKKTVIPLSKKNPFSLEGPNGIGKTTVAAAIAYGLYGVTLSGTDKTSSLQQDADLVMSVKIETDKAVIERSRVRDTSTLLLNDKKIKQSELDALLPDKDIFMSMFYTGYFFKLSEAKQKEVILNSFKTKSIDEIFEKFGPLEILEAGKKNIKGLSLAIEELDYIKAYKLIYAESVELNEHLESERKNIDNPELEKKEKKINRQEIDTKPIEDRIEKLRNMIASKQNEETQEPMRKSLKEKETKYTELSKAVPVTKEQGSKCEAIFNKSKELYEDWLQLKPHKPTQDKYVRKVGEMCPTCGVTLTEELFEAVKKVLDEKLLRKQNTFDIELTNWEQELKRKKELLDGNEEIYTAYIKEYQNYAKINNELNTISNDIKEMKKMLGNVEKVTEDLDDLMRERTEQETKLKKAIEENKEIAIHNSNVESYNKALENYNKSVENVKANFKKLEGKSKALEILKQAFAQSGIPTLQAELLSEELAKDTIMPLKFRTMRRQQNGAMVSCFEVMDDKGVVYENQSTGEQLKTGLSIQEMLFKKFPRPGILFIEDIILSDNKAGDKELSGIIEGIARQGAQVIIAKTTGGING